MDKYQTKQGDSVRQKEIYKITIVGSITNFMLLIFKFTAGILGNSAAMIADAVHSLSDFGTDIIVLLFVRISGKPQDKDHDYGHGKYETIATMLVGGVLLFVGIKILKDSLVTIWQVFHGVELPKPGIIALIAALLSVVSKEILFRYTMRRGKHLNSNAVIANAWHHRSDALSSIGTAVGIGGAVLLGDNWSVLDPIAALIVSVFIIKVAIQLLIPGFNELTEASLPEDVEKDIENIILSYPEVSDPHKMRTRRIGNYCAVDVHIRLDKDMTLEEVHNITIAIEKELRLCLGEKTLINIHAEPKK